MKLLKKGDFIIFALVAALAAALLFLPKNEGAGAAAQIILKGAVVDELSLESDRALEYDIDGVRFIADIKGGKIAISEISCPDHLCVKTGYIGSAGQSIICLPNRLVIKIISGSEWEVDAVAK